MSTNKKSATMHNLGKLMDKSHIEPLALSNKLGVSRELIYKLEDGSSSGSIDTLIKIADYFKVSTDYVLGRTNVELPINELDKGLTENEANLLNKYHELSDEDKLLVDGFVFGLITKNK